MSVARSGRFVVVAANRSVAIAVGRLRGRERDSYDAAKSDLEVQGCRQGGYRLVAADGTPSVYCCKHLYGSLRLVTTFDESEVVVAAIGNHDGNEFYKVLASDLGTSAVGQHRNSKPPCCGPDGWLVADLLDSRNVLP